MWRITEKFRRIKRGNVVAKKVMLSLKRRPGGIHDKGGQSEKNEQRLCPPNVGAHGLAEGTARQLGGGVGHERV